MKIVPVLPVLRSKVKIPRRFYEILRRCDFARLQLLDTLLASQGEPSFNPRGSTFHDLKVECAF